MPDLVVSGIYKIVNLVNSKIYVGSAVNVRKRWNLHLTYLRQQRHHSKHLQASFNKYGRESFIIELLEEVPREHLLEREQFYLNSLRPFDGTRGYNICPIAGSVLGVKRSATVREAMRQRMLGRVPWNKGIKRPPYSAQWKANIGAAMLGEKNHFFGKTHTDESKRIIATKTKQRLADPTKNYFYGKHFTGSSNWMFGKTHMPEAKAKISARSKGYKHTEEARRKMSEFRRGRKLLKNAKAVIQIAVDGSHLNTYPSITEAANAVGITIQAISIVLRGRGKTAKGYRWEYA